MAKGGYYAVQKGNSPGIYLTWDECKGQVDGFPGAIYKKFTTLKEAESFVGVVQLPAKVDSTVSSKDLSTPSGGKPLLESYYAVQVGRVPGVYETWGDCEAQVKGFNGAVFRKFNTLAKATSFAESTASGADTKTSKEVKPMRTDKINSATTGTKATDIKEGWDVVYTDGACKGNGTVGSVAGIGVWWGWDDPRNLFERCPGDQTNNRAELIALIRVLETTPISEKSLLIKTDSKYSIKCVELWIHNWLKRNWKTSTGTDVKNRNLIQYLSLLLSKRAYASQKVRLEHVRGHQGIEGNEAADLLANRGVGLKEENDRDWDVLVKALENELGIMERKKLGQFGTDELVQEKIQFDIEDVIEEGDLLSQEELDELSRTQNFD